MIHKVITFDSSYTEEVGCIEFKDRASANAVCSKLKNDRIDLAFVVSDIEYSLNDIFIKMIAANPMEKVETHWVNAQEAYKIILDNYLKEKEVYKSSKKSKSIDT